MDVGFSDILLNMLSLRLIDLSFRDRQCAVVFDEMALKSQLTYDKHRDGIVGYTADGQLATHVLVLVFMVRGLQSKWRQAVGYFLTHNTASASHLADLITECVE